VPCVNLVRIITIAYACLVTVTFNAHAGIFDNLKKKAEHSIQEKLEEMRHSTQRQDSTDAPSPKERDHTTSPVPPEKPDTPFPTPTISHTVTGKGPISAQPQKVDGAIPDLTYNSLFLIGLKHNPKVAENDYFVANYELSQVRANTPECTERMQLLTPSNPIASARLKKQARKRFQSVLDRVRSEPDRKLVRFIEKARLVKYDFKRKGIVIRVPSSRDLAPDLRGSCARTNSGTLISIAFEQLPELFVPISENEAEKMMEPETFLNVEMVIEIGGSERPAEATRMRLRGTFKKVTVLTPGNDSVIANWDEADFDRIKQRVREANSLEAKVAAAALQRKELKEHVNVRKLEIQGVTIGMRLGDAKKILEHKGYKQQPGRTRYTATFLRIDGPVKKTVFVDVAKDADSMDGRTVFDVAYNQQFSEGFAFNLGQIEKQVRKRFGAPQKYEPGRVRTLEYWSLSSVPDETFVSVARKCNEEARKIFKSQVTRRLKNPTGFGAEHTFRLCKGTLDEQRKIIEYLSPYRLTVRLNQSIRSIFTEVSWRYPPEAAQLATMHEKAAQDASRPEASFDF